MRTKSIIDKVYLIIILRVLLADVNEDSFLKMKVIFEEDIYKSWEILIFNYAPYF